MFTSWPVVRCHRKCIVGLMSAMWTDSGRAARIERAVVSERKVAQIDRAPAAIASQPQALQSGAQNPDPDYSEYGRRALKRRQWSIANPDAAQLHPLVSF